MGGGACWSGETCFGHKIRTWIFPLPTSPVMSWLSNDLGPASMHGPLSDASMIYFPYCTGDVHAGRHDTKYHGITVHHQGFNNVTKALAYLQTQGLINYQSFRDIVMFGASAGAHGALNHAVSIEQYLLPQQRKVLLLDAPGMHFGEQFWHKFPEQYVGDIQASFARLGINFTRQDHNLAPFIPVAAKYLKNWRIGVLQGARDVVMSEVFGNISPNNHRQLVYGERGIYNLSMLTKNVSVWLPDTLFHTFLLTPASAQVRANQLSAAEFAELILNTNDVWYERNW
jgi:hypothetical protein